MICGALAASCLSSTEDTHSFKYDKLHNEHTNDTQLFYFLSLPQTHSNLEHLAMMEAILGPLPSSFYRDTRDTNKTKYFWHGHLDWDTDTSDGRYVRETCRKLKVSRHVCLCVCGVFEQIWLLSGTTDLYIV